MVFDYLNLVVKYVIILFSMVNALYNNSQTFLSGGVIQWQHYIYR